MADDAWFPFSRRGRDADYKIVTPPAPAPSVVTPRPSPATNAGAPRPASETRVPASPQTPTQATNGRPSSPPAEDLLCSHCSSWKTRADDAWCGNCGEPCARVRLSVEPPVMQIGNLLPPIKVFVENPSCGNIRVLRWSTPEWIVLGDTPAVLSAGQRTAFAARANTLLLEHPETAPVVVETEAGAFEALVIAMEERPSIVSDPAEIELWRVPGGEMPSVSVKLAPKTGFLRIRGVRAGGYAGLEVVSRLDAPVMASSSSGLTVALRAQADRFLNQPSASLLVDLDGPHGITQVEVPIKVAVRNPPEIAWDGENLPPAEHFQSAAQRISIVLANRSPRDRDGGGGANARLRIESATLNSPPGLNIPVRVVQGVPVTLAGGESATIVFEANLTEAPVRTGVPVPLKFRLRVHSNAALLDKPVSIAVRPLPVFDGVLAIDFGSTNTCCALLETGRESELLRFDDASASPTIVRYLDLTGLEPEVEIGTRVKRVVRLDAKVAASAIDSLKQRLGDEPSPIWVIPYNASEHASRTATQAASDYLREVRTIVERSKTTLFDDFILTHPAVCSLRQFRNLRRALLWGFGSSASRPPRFLQEPIAALVPFMAKKARDRDTNSYTVASFDLGGGTTDIAALRVEHRLLSGGRIEIRPEIRYSRGVRFGGEDLTSFLVAEFEARLARLITQSEPGFVLVKEGAPGAPPEDARLNRLRLREVADAFKVRLSEQSNNQDPELPRLRIMRPGGTGLKNFSRSFADIRAAGDPNDPKRPDLDDLFIDVVRNRVWHHTRLLQAAARPDRAGHLDYIQVSGKTAYIPAVLDTVRYVFPRSDVFRAGDPKDCVVAGACLARAMGRNSAIRLVLPDSAQRTTSAIGTYDEVARIFSAVIPIDQAIPDEGLSRDADMRWFGSERVPLWENLGIEDDELRDAGTAGLSKLGTWIPARPEPAADNDTGWTLRLLLKDFDLTVTAVGPAGQIVPFTRRPEPNEAEP